MSHDRTARGVGILSGAGLIAHPDGTLEPVRHAVEEFTFTDGKLRRAVLLPELVTASDSGVELSSEEPG